jgi:hypothetical protein
MQPTTAPQKNNRGRPPNIKKAKFVEKKTENYDLEKGEENKSGSNNVSQNKPIIVSFP